MPAPYGTGPGVRNAWKPVVLADSASVEAPVALQVSLIREAVAPEPEGSAGLSGEGRAGGASEHWRGFQGTLLSTRVEKRAESPLGSVF